MTAAPWNSQSACRTRRLEPTARPSDAYYRQLIRSISTPRIPRSSPSSSSRRATRYRTARMTATAAGMSRTALIACWPYSLGAFAESPGVSPRSFRGLSASRSWRLKLYQHQDVELLGAGSGRERVQAFPESLLEVVGTHCR